MSSDFEKALARAAAERNARDEAKMIEEREHAEKVKLAHSIIDPYLAELGPQVVRTLRDLRIFPPGKPSNSNRGWWTFRYYSESDIPDRCFSLNELGKFVAGSHVGQGQISHQFEVGLISGQIVLWNEIQYMPLMLANPNDRKVYLVRRVSSGQNGFFQELSEFIAYYIQLEMKS